jgi:hypothetical protein
MWSMESATDACFHERPQPSNMTHISRARTILCVLARQTVLSLRLDQPHLGALLLFIKGGLP